MLNNLYCRYFFKLGMHWILQLLKWIFLLSKTLFCAICFLAVRYWFCRESACSCRAFVLFCPTIKSHQKKSDMGRTQRLQLMASPWKTQGRIDWPSWLETLFLKMLPTAHSKINKPTESIHLKKCIYFILYTQWISLFTFNSFYQDD